MVFYDRNGVPVAYSEDNEHIYLFDGKPVAFLKSDIVYNFSGKQLGRFNNGWVRDLKGYCVFFTEETSGTGPVKPVKRVLPIKSVKHIQPVKSITAIPHIKVVNVLSWSDLSGKKLFQ